MNQVGVSKNRCWDKTPRPLKYLFAGLILTSFASYDPEINDQIFNAPGSFKKIIRGMRLGNFGAQRLFKLLIKKGIDAD